MLDDDVGIGLHRYAIIGVLFHQARGGREIIVPTQGGAGEIRIQSVHNFVHAKYGARIFQNNHQANSASLILRMSALNQSLGMLNHDADVRGLLFVLQLWNIKCQRLGVVPVGVKMQREVIQVKWKRICFVEQERARNSEPRKSLDWLG